MYALAFAAGVLLRHFLGWPALEPALFVLAAAMGLGCLAIAPLRLPACLLLGLAWAGGLAGMRVADRLPGALVGQDLRVLCRIDDFPRRRGEGIRFACHCAGGHRVDGGTPVSGLPDKLRLAWERPGRLPRPGETWRFTVRLKPPDGMRNPAGFDYAAWLFRKGFGATGYVRRWPAPEFVRDDAGPLQRLRRRLAAHLEEIPALPSAGLLRAVTLGIRDRPDPERQRVYRVTGTAHLFAISGLHIGMVSGLVLWLTGRLWRCSATLCRWLPAPVAAALAALLAATGYAALAGFSLPTRRALVMLAVLHGGRILGRPPAPGQAFSLALFAVVLLDPLSVGGADFWLSFAAVFALWMLAAGVAGRGRLAGLRRALRTQWRLSLALVPVTAVLFQQVSWLSPLANLVAIPLFGALVLPAALLGLCLAGVPGGLSEGLLRMAGLAAEAITGLLAPLAALPAAEWRWTPPPGTRAFLFGALLVFLLPKGVPGRRLGPLLLLPVFWRGGDLAPGRFELLLFDVGQGLAAAVRTAGHVLVFDTGWRSRAGFDTGSAVVLPWLVAQGVRHVDMLVVSHGDLDHRGGARPLDRAMPVHRLLTSVPERIDWRPVQRCREGQAWTWDGVRFRMLAPFGRVSGNDASCVLQVEASNGQRLLLTGDIEQVAEQRLLARYPDLKAEVLVVPHHGSRTSSSPAFVQRVRPRHALVPAGRRNRYGLPAPEVVGRYRAAGSRVWITGGVGAVRCRLGGPGPATCHRAAPGSPADPGSQDENGGATSYDGAVRTRLRGSDS